MSAPDTTKFQVNYKLADGTLINLYAADSAELEKGLGDLAMVAALIKSTSVELGGGTPVQVIKQAFPGATPVAQSAPAQGASPTCAHGPMKWNEGTNAQGKDWKGWFCSGPKDLPREQKCDTIWKR